MNTWKVILGVLMLVVLGACSSPAITPAPTKASAVEPTKAPVQPTVAPTAQPLAAPIKLTIWSGWPEMQPVYEAAAKWYKELHPNVTIEFSGFPIREVERKYAVSLPTKTGPDIVDITGYTAQPQIENGSLLPNPPEVDAFFKSGVYHPLYVSDSTYQGKTYGIPVLFSISGMLWNTDMFKEAGLAAPPKTIDEAIEMGKKLTKTDAQGNVTRSGWGLRLFGGGAGVSSKWWYFVKSAGGDLFEQCTPNSTKYRAGYDNDAGRQVLKMYIDVVHKYKIHDPKLKQDAEGFATQQAAMFVREGWLIPYMQKNAPTVKFDSGPLPAVKKNNTLLYWTNLVVTNSSKNPKEAWDFIMFMANGPKLKELERIQLEQVGWLPPRSDLAKRHSDVYTQWPAYKWFAEAPGYELYPYPRVSVTDEVFTKLSERLVAAYGDARLVDNPAGIAKVIKDAADETNAILKENGLYCGQ